MISRPCSGTHTHTERERERERERETIKNGRNGIAHVFARAQFGRLLMRASTFGHMQSKFRPKCPAELSAPDASKRPAENTKYVPVAVRTIWDRQEVQAGLCWKLPLVTACAESRKIYCWSHFINAWQSQTRSPDNMVSSSSTLFFASASSNRSRLMYAASAGSTPRVFAAGSFRALFSFSHASSR